MHTQNQTSVGSECGSIEHRSSSFERTSLQEKSQLYTFEANEAVIKMIIKGISPTTRHVSRTHRVALDWLFDRINLDPKIQIKYIDTKNQVTDILTKKNFTRDEWNHLLCLFNISHFSSTKSLEVMLKRTQEDAGEERVTAKSNPMMNLVSRYRVRDPNVLAWTASESPGNTKSDSQNVPLSSLNVQQTSSGRPGETCDERKLIKLIRLKHWRKVVFSRVEIWWNVWSKNGETRGWTTVHPEDR